MVLNVPCNFLTISASGMLSSGELLGSTVFSAMAVSSLSGTSICSVFIGGSLTVGATLLLFLELILLAVGPDLFGFAAGGLGLGMTGIGTSSKLEVSPYFTPVLALRGFLHVRFEVWALLDRVKCSPMGKSDAAVGGTLSKSSASMNSSQVKFTEHGLVSTHSPSSKFGSEVGVSVSTCSTGAVLGSVDVSILSMASITVS